MRKRSIKRKDTPSIKVIDVEQDIADPANELIRLIPEDSSEGNVVYGDTNTKSNTPIFESDVLADELKSVDQQNLGRGFRSKELSIDDLESVNTAIDLERGEQSSVDHSDSNNRWPILLIGTGAIVLLAFIGWTYFNVERNAETVKAITTVNEISRSGMATPEVLDPGLITSESSTPFNKEKAIAVATGFLEASNSNERLKWCFNPDETLKKMNHYYSRGNKFQPFEVKGIKAAGPKIMAGVNAIIVKVATVSVDAAESDDEIKHVVLRAHDDGSYDVDWPSSMMYQPSDLKVFTESMITDPQTFRVEISSRVAAGPYLYSFKDDTKYQSYRINLPEDEESYLYGYTKVGSKADLVLRQFFSKTKTPQKVVCKIVVTLAYPENSETAQCVEIVEVLSKNYLIP